MKQKHRKGFFITFEKTAEGLGGTTQSKRLVETLQKEGIEAVWTREPGGTEVGMQIREILLSPDKRDLSRATELLLYFADRAQNYREIIKPGLLSGKVVVSDRYLDSSLIYQGVGREWSRGFLLRLHQAATGALMPDLTIVLDGISHRAVPNDDRFEQMDAAFHAKLKEAMLHQAATHERYVVVNANRPMDTVAAEIRRVVHERMLRKQEALRKDTK